VRRRRAGLTEPEAINVLRVVAALGALFLIAYTHVDPDLWGHVRFGEDIIDDAAIATRDPYSFTTDQSWVNHEWLAELLMGLAYRAGGAMGLVVLKAATVVAMLLLVSKALRRVSWRPSDHDMLIALAILATTTRTHLVRPQLFSLLLFAALLSVLIAADRGNRRALLALPVIMAAWTNLHGGWLVGLGMLTIWVTVRFVRSAPAALGRPWLAGLWAACIGATLVNPYGTGLWRFLRDTVGLSRPDVADWLPLLELPVLAIAMTAIVGVVAIVAVAKARRNADPAYILIVVALAVLTLRVGRIDAFFALAVVMLLGPYLGRGRAARWDPVASDGPPLWRRPLPVAIVLAAVAGLSMTAGPKVTCIALLSAPEAEATAFLKRHPGRADVLNFFDWGEYAIWHLSPRLRVSMDGRRETVYSNGLIEAHARLYVGAPGATDLVRRIHPDLIWLPVASPAVSQLERQGWQRSFEGRLSVVLERSTDGRPVISKQADRKNRCFPDA
jgi:hypothetical protein